MNFQEQINRDLGKNTELQEGEAFGCVICAECGCEEIWPQSVDHEEFPMDAVYSDVTPLTLWICINGHVSWPMQEIIQAGLSHYRVLREV